MNRKFRAVVAVQPCELMGLSEHVGEVAETHSKFICSLSAKADIVNSLGAISIAGLSPSNQRKQGITATDGVLTPINFPQESAL
jgi:hypothetical protein